jgi:hypothetical protein
MSLYIREKKNKSGSVSVIIIDRNNRGYKVVETIGCAYNETDLEIFLDIAQARLKELNKKLYPSLFDVVEPELPKHQSLQFINIYNRDMMPVGDELIYGELFKQIGCNKIFVKDKEYKLFKALVISRLLYPGSKLYTIDYIEYFKKEKIDKNKIYRFLDTLYTPEIKSNIERCVFTHTKEIMNDTITVTFYDVTTLYFESESEDDLRRIGFSKEGKLARPQIQLGLFTTLEGYPLSYEVYEGNKYEGHTLVDILVKFQTRFQLKNRPIVVADRGMLTNANLAFLENNNYKYILAYKIKNISNEFKEKIVSLPFVDDGVIHTIEYDKEIVYDDENGIKQSINVQHRLILTYSTKRAKKDKRAREKALQKLEKKLSQNITKKDLKLSHYAKYLDIDEKCTIGYKLNLDKVQQDEKLDGIKGYVTNEFTLTSEEVIQHYQNQYEVERAFRISKTDLRIRPIYHRLETRIKAHILISFVSYAIYKEFERKLKIHGVKFKFSQKLLRDIIKHMMAIRTNGKLVYLKFDEIQQSVLDAIYN